MKDKKHSATSITEPHSLPHSGNAAPRKQQPSAEDRAQAVKLSIERDKINRRYSFDDNGGGYLGL